MSSANFDIEQLLTLAQTDPAALEALRDKRTEALIARASPDSQRRLRGLQFQIDCQRRIHKTPLGACVAISQMMMVSLAKLNGALHGELPQDVDRSGAVLNLAINRAAADQGGQNHC